MKAETADKAGAGETENARMLLAEAERTRVMVGKVATVELAALAVMVG